MNTWNDDLDNDDNNSGGGALRGQLEEALKKLKAAEKRAAEAEQKIAVNTVSASLKDKGYKESAAKFAALSGVNLSDEKALDAWLESDGGDFKLPESEQTPAQEAEQSAESQEPTISSDVIASYGNLAGVRNTSEPAYRNKLASAITGLPDNATVAQVDAALKGL